MEIVTAELSAGILEALSVILFEGAANRKPEALDCCGAVGPPGKLRGSCIDSLGKRTALSLQTQSSSFVSCRGRGLVFHSKKNMNLFRSSHIFSNPSSKFQCTNIMHVYLNLKWVGTFQMHCSKL